MPGSSSATIAVPGLDLIDIDLDLREELIRERVYETLAELPAEVPADHFVATYYLQTRSARLPDAGDDLPYHMTCGIRNPPPNTLLAECRGYVLDWRAFDMQDRVGIVRVAYPIKMFTDAQGTIYTSDILHITAGAALTGLVENIDAKLVHLAFDDATLRAFPGPRYGAAGVRRLAGFPEGQLAFGTILKPCTGILPAEEAEILRGVAGNPAFLFIKEDENFIPHVHFAPLRERLKASLEAIREVAPQRGGVGLIYAPHITCPPHRMREMVETALELGANGLMFSEYYVGGMLRAVRDMTTHLPQPPALYGHNGGITSRTHTIYSEVLDLLARLDGLDFRQTSVLVPKGGQNMIRPVGLEWRKCEEALTRPLAGHPAVMIARAGGLDQGNLIPNLDDIERQGGDITHYLLLAGSAINTIKDEHGRYDSAIGYGAMQEAYKVYQSKAVDPQSPTIIADLKAYAKTNNLKNLTRALDQRYPGK